MSVLLLFDIDGTLLLTGGAGLRALDRAFQELYDLRDAMRGRHCDGKTDALIVREVLAPRGLDTDANILSLLESYLHHLGDCLAEGRDGVRLLPGVLEALAYLAGRPEVVLGLATGNLEHGARLKLEAVGLRGHFAFGGYGSDAELRADVVRAAIRRGRARVREPGAPAVVIGDTPRDVIAAHEATALAVGVASASYSVEVLVQAGADMVLPSLEQPESWLPRLLALVAERQALAAVSDPGLVPGRSPGFIRLS